MYWEDGVDTAEKGQLKESNSLDPSFRAFSEFFVIFAEPSVSPQPSQGALHMRPTFARKSESHP